MSVVRYDYCPVCFSLTTFEINPKKMDEYHPSNNKWWGGTSKVLYPYCKNCGWKGDWDDCLDEDEAKSAKRTKIIDDVLNEKIQRS